MGAPYIYIYIYIYIYDISRLRVKGLIFVSVKDEELLEHQFDCRRLDHSLGEQHIDYILNK